MPYRPNVAEAGHRYAFGVSDDAARLISARDVGRVRDVLYRAAGSVADRRACVVTARYSAGVDRDVAYRSVLRVAEKAGVVARAVDCEAEYVVVESVEAACECVVLARAYRGEACSCIAVDSAVVAAVSRVVRVDGVAEGIPA